jgi:hypothetical protein
MVVTRPIYRIVKRWIFFGRWDENALALPIFLRSEFTEMETTAPLPTECVANFFNIRAENVRQIRHRALTKRMQPSGPLTLAPEQENDIVR